MDQRMLTEQFDYENFLLKVLRWVFVGVAVTAVTSIVVILSGVINYLIDFYFPVLFISVIVEIAFVWVIGKKLQNHGDQVSYAMAKRYFILYSIVNGVVFSFILSVISVYITALAFALTCAYFGLLYNKIYKFRFLFCNESLYFSITDSYNWIYYFNIYSCTCSLLYYCFD